jgi:hypothetical protein
LQKVIGQAKFYKGVIYFEAVGQSWAFKGTPYETVEWQLKDLKIAATDHDYAIAKIGRHQDVPGLPPAIGVRSMEMNEPSPNYLRQDSRTLPVRVFHE